MKESDQHEHYGRQPHDTTQEQYSRDVRSRRWRRAHQMKDDLSFTPPETLADSPDQDKRASLRSASLLNASSPAERLATARFTATAAIPFHAPDDAPALTPAHKLGGALQRFSGTDVASLTLVQRQEQRAQTVTLALVSVAVVLVVISAYLLFNPTSRHPGFGLAPGQRNVIVKSTGVTIIYRSPIPQPPTATPVAGGHTYTTPTAQSKATVTPASPGALATNTPVAVTPTGTLVPATPTATSVLPTPTATFVPPTATRIPPTATPIPLPGPGTNLLENPGLDAYGGWCVWNNLANAFAGCNGAYYTSFIEGSPPPTHRAQFASAGYFDVTTYQNNLAPVSANYYASVWVTTTCDRSGSSFFLKNTDTGQEAGNVNLPACISGWTKYTIGPVFWNANQPIAFEVRSHYYGGDWARFFGATLCYTYGSNSCA